jgi:hypothetical protein
MKSQCLFVRAKLSDRTPDFKELGQILSNTYPLMGSVRDGELLPDWGGDSDVLIGPEEPISWWSDRLLVADCRIDAADGISVRHVKERFVFSDADALAIGTFDVDDLDNRPSSPSLQVAEIMTRCGVTLAREVLDRDVSIIHVKHSVCSFLDIDSPADWEDAFRIARQNAYAIGALSEKYPVLLNWGWLVNRQWAERNKVHFDDSCFHVREV